ncbi:hypothetical protein GF339_13080 [candidate division KSB3 bacterium]|uniref:Uncharacterized protein n=1 Tax=candidate division KSB3 bacterium TaxID=2044937 RepID=A0A9D5JWD9_9BACT|nr:hypothetical protein [candidate division KSB3 bacterium]MBD3325517.1 hypothetical protein [candidate division KSB3 bacterium]
MDKDTKQPEEKTQVVADQQTMSPDALETHIAEELQKVVGIDTDQLKTYIDVLGALKPKDAQSLLKRLKKQFGEQLLPLLEIMAQHDQHPIADMGIQGLGTVKSFKAAQLLADINETHPEKTLRKAARKSLYKLKTAGIEIETSQKPLLGEAKHTPYKALLSPIDGTGTQLIMLTEEMLAGDLHLLQIVTSDEDGIIECSARRGMTKKMFANLPETFARQTGNAEPMLFEADYAYAASLVLTAEAESDDDLLPDEYLANKRLFGLTDASSSENPVYQTFDAENLKNQPYFLRTSVELFQHDTILSWHIPVNELAEYAQELLDQEDSVLELSPQFQHERKEAIYQKVFDAYCDEDFIQRLRRRLEIMAYLYLQQHQEDDAKKALTAALTLGEPSELQTRNHPFLRQLILNSLEATEYVLEEGYDAEDLDRSDYFLRRNDEGDITVEFVEQT